MSTLSLQATMAECHSPTTSEDRLVVLLSDSRILIRINSMLALARRRPVNEILVVNAILKAALLAMGGTPIFGTMTERMMAAYALHGIGTSLGNEGFTQIKSLLSRTEVSDLEWHILHNPKQALK